MKRDRARPPKRVVVTVCPREPGSVLIPVEPGGRRVRLDARSIVSALEALIARRGIADRVRVETGCAGGCFGRGPNVSVAFYAARRAGEPVDNVALRWRTYVGSLATLDCLARVLDENGARRPRTGATSRPRRRAPRPRAASSGARTRRGR
jgi:hypothetical protein